MSAYIVAGCPSTGVPGHSLDKPVERLSKWLRRAVVLKSVNCAMSAQPSASRLQLVVSADTSTLERQYLLKLIVSFVSSVLSSATAFVAAPEVAKPFHLAGPLAFVSNACPSVGPSINLLRYPTVIHSSAVLMALPFAGFPLFSIHQFRCSRRRNSRLQCLRRKLILPFVWSFEL